MSGSSGLSAMIAAAAAFETELGMETLSIRSLPAPGADPCRDCTMEICGRWLAYTVSLRGAEVHLSAVPMDSPAAPEFIVRLADSAGGWDTLRRLIASMGRHEVRSLQRPIEVGEPGEPDAWVIG